MNNQKFSASRSALEEPANTSTESGHVLPELLNRYAPFSLRAALIGLAMCPLLVFGAEFTEIVARGADVIGMSLILAVGFALVVTVALNLLVKRIAPRVGLTQAELLVVYTINSASFGICGLGVMQFVPNMLAGPAYYATAANGWNKWEHYIPSWAVPAPSVVHAYYAGHSSFFTPAHVTGWIAPIIIWSAAILVAFFCTYCIGVLLRKQWVERERLLFPIVIIPLEITRDGGDSPLWRSRVFWGGCILAVVLESLAAVHYSINPAVPYVPIKPGETALTLTQCFTTPPWSGVGTLQLAFYPLVIGLTYLLSLDVSFSCWFFYVFFKLESVLSVAFGFRDPGASAAMSRVPYIAEQSVGAYIGLALMSLFFAWPQIRKSFLIAFGPKTGGDAEDADEPLSYRTAFIGLLASFVALCGFAVALGCSVVTAVVFFFLFLIVTVAVSRIRAEAGLPWSPGPAPATTMVNMGGSSAFGTQDLVGLSFVQVFGSDFRTSQMPAQMEAMKIASSSQIHPRHLTYAIFAGAVVVLVASWVSILAIYYHYGASTAIVDSWRSSWGSAPYTQLQGWISTRKPADGPALSALATGLAITILLSVLRTKFVWWPLHPIGFAVGGSGIDWIWFPILLGWAFKYLTLRYGGIKSYREILPFFIGLVIGDYVISALWAIVYLITGLPGYRTFPI